MSLKRRDSRCQAIAKSGKPCRAAATGSGLCFLHGNPKKAAELGSIGGRRNRRPRTGSADPLPPADSATSAVENLNWIYDRVQKGTIEPKIANTLLKVIIAKEQMKDRLVIERQMADMQDDLRTLKSMIQIRDIEASTLEK